VKLALALLLASSLAFADPAADAPRKDEIVPMTQAEAVACLTCAADLRDEKASGTKWILVGVGAGVLTGFLAGLAVGLAVKRP
jgi:hypothetical protein